jgi:hypothetical protein
LWSSVERRATAYSGRRTAYSALKTSCCGEEDGGDGEEARVDDLVDVVRNVEDVVCAAEDVVLGVVDGVIVLDWGGEEPARDAGLRRDRDPYVGGHGGRRNSRGRGGRDLRAALEARGRNNRAAAT